MTDQSTFINRWGLPWKRGTWTALKSARLQLRFLLPLVITLIAAAYVSVPLLDQVTLRWFSRDLNSRGVLVANALSDSVADAVFNDRLYRLAPIFDRAAQDERLFALGLCNPDGRLLQRTSRFPEDLNCAEALRLAQQVDPRLSLAGGPVHVGVHRVMGHRPAPSAGEEGDDEGEGVISHDGLRNINLFDVEEFQRQHD